ncbi:MAG: hypothetical protein KIH63_003920 [Candidatus Saccharibacteria bacterium]|nr:hypothetical protein [Candidatus Saccharibacteria bacterium]
MTDFSETKQYLQDIAKVIGKFQQAFLVPDKNYWHVGLEVRHNGFQTQEFTIDGKPCRVYVDLKNGIICSSIESWSMGWVSPVQLQNDLEYWLRELDSANNIEHVEGLHKTPSINQESALEILNLLSKSQKVLGSLKLRLPTGRSSPLLLYPHHFDLAYTWYPHEGQQYTVGMSLGDEHIRQPYFYITAFPETMEFASRAPQLPAVWHKQGFTGVVIRVADIDERRFSAQLKKHISAALGIEI